MHGVCRCCGQPLPKNVRYGVRLSNTKLAIFDLVKARPGITQIEILQAVFEGKDRDKNTVSAHVIQINDLFADTDLRIIGRTHHGYRLHVPPGMR